MAGLVSKERKPTPWLSFSLFLMVALTIAAIGGAVVCSYLAIAFPVEEWRATAVLFVLSSIGSSIPTLVIWYIRDRISITG